MDPNGPALTSTHGSVQVQDPFSALHQPQQQVAAGFPQPGRWGTPWGAGDARISGTLRRNRMYSWVLGYTGHYPFTLSIYYFYSNNREGKKKEKEDMF